MKFRVIGPRTVAGVEPGKTGEFAEDDPVNVDALIAGGHIEPVEGASKKDAAAAADTERAD